MSHTVTLNASGEDFPAYIATPGVPVRKIKGAVIVIHEVWGLVDHIRGVADRWAAEGFLALAPDLMGGLGVTADVGAELQRNLVDHDAAQRSAAQERLAELMAPITAPAFATSAIQKLLACVDYLEQQPGVAGRIGVTGFSFGGSYAFSLTVADARVKACAPFSAYANLSNELLAEIGGPVLYFVGEEDAALFAALPVLTRQMSDSGVDFTAIAYRNAGHAFFNETNPHAYRADAAKDSWKKSVAFFTKHLAPVSAPPR